jgi:hypothetical protein
VDAIWLNPHYASPQDDMVCGNLYCKKILKGSRTYARTLAFPSDARVTTSRITVTSTLLTDH